ncbi:hypothetical protein Thini_2740 [Thiothrix nivea DSM 5205]|uniref:Uncharacterized protein n=1 Tax=Thiothrix nivea (strain ATCC 35100 / DSM 5205 / JP2) TaxID=870187 RepID=A0A656HFP9_THINJ|nr:hypothetical protein Thini_2740 [Thiothrix nivea DSM 5205]
MKKIGRHRRNSSCISFKRLEWMMNRKYRGLVSMNYRMGLVNGISEKK